MALSRHAGGGAKAQVLRRARWVAARGSFAVGSIATGLWFRFDGWWQGFVTFALMSVFAYWLYLPEVTSLKGEPHIPLKEGLEKALKNVLRRAGVADGRVQCCVWMPHRRTANDETLVQVTERVPGGGSVGVKRSSSKGVTGLAYRQGSTEVQSVDGEPGSSPERYQAYLVDQWGYELDEAKRLHMDRRSFLATPIKAADDVIVGVVTFDSHDPTLLVQADLIVKLVNEAVHLADWLV
jgi:hypothetical protein